MNRRSFIQAAALLPAVASQTVGRMRLPHLPAAVIQVDIADPGTTDRQIQNASEVFVRLFELDGDPGQLSGARLVISDSGAYASVSVHMGEHFLGFAGRDGLRRFFEVAEERGEADTSFSLLERFPDEPYPCSHNLGFVTLIPGADPELRVVFGRHCFGSLKGRLAARFLACVRQRCGAEEA